MVLQLTLNFKVVILNAMQTGFNGLLMISSWFLTVLRWLLMIVCYKLFYSSWCRLDSGCCSCEISNMPFFVLSIMKTCVCGLCASSAAETDSVMNNPPAVLAWCCSRVEGKGSGFHGCIMWAQLFCLTLGRRVQPHHRNSFSELCAPTVGVLFPVLSGMMLLLHSCFILWAGTLPHVTTIHQKLSPWLK